MAFAGARLPNFCLNRIVAHIRERSSHVSSKPVCTPFKANGDQKNELFHSSDHTEKTSSVCGEDAKSDNQIGKRIMIVVDSSPEAKGALQWTLSHTASDQDTIILLYVSKSCVQGKNSDQTNPRIYEMLSSMRSFCHNKRPEVHIEVSFVIGNQKDKGAVIVEEAKKQGATLLVLGHKKRSMRWQLLMIWAGARFGSGATTGGGGGGGVVEYCIQNAHCMAIAVRRKSRRLGGYLITTKRHKDFWLLA